jgi:hypothetical protein
MAKSVQMKHKQTGIIKNGYYGFSWTSFFFGGFPALFRGDIGYGLGILVAGLLVGAFSGGLLWFAVSLVWAFVYNKNYTHRLLQSGYEFNDRPDVNSEAKKVLGVEP